MSCENLPICSVCGVVMSNVGVLCTDTDVVRVLTCPHGHFYNVMTPQDHAVWVEGATSLRFYEKLTAADLIPDDLQKLWARKENTWHNLQAVVSSDLEIDFGVVMPCPFCHSSKTLVMRDSRYHFLCCDACDTLGPEADDLLDAVCRWNAR